MARATKRPWAGWIGGALLVLGATEARADWPSSRGDSRRTGTSSGPAALTSPAPYYRISHGGRLWPDGALVADVDGDGTLEAVLASGDGVSAKRPTTGELLWRNPDLEFGILHGLADLDGDGTLELVAHAHDQAYVVRLADGATLWAEPPGEMGSLSAVRVGDLSGDGHPDLVVHECGCCSINSGKSALVYRFAGEGASLTTPALMWTPPTPYCGGSRSATLARMRSATTLDFVFGTNLALELRDGKTGAVVAAMPTFGVAVQASSCRPLDLERDGREELLCVLIDNGSTKNNGRRAYLVKYVEDPEPKLKVVWQTLVGTEDGNVRVPPSFVGDLDGDGADEFTLSGKNEAGAWTTYVFDVASGAERGRLPGTTAAGIAKILPNGGSALLVDDAGTLAAHALGAGPKGTLAPLWKLPERGAASDVDYEADQRRSLSSRLVTFDLDGDGTEELVTTRASGDALDVVRASATKAEIVGTYAAPAGVGVVAVGVHRTASTPVLAVAQSDGNFHLLDGALAPVSGIPSFGARFGGFYATSQFRSLAPSPTVGDLGDGIPGLMFVTSRGALVRADARDAGFAAPPRVLWERARTQAAQIVAGLAGGKPGIVAVEKRLGDSDAVVALAADGSLRWSHAVPGVVLADLTVGNLDGDGIPDVVAQHGDLGDTIDRVTALSGATGEVLWNAAPIGPYNRQPSGGALADWNGDGADDYAFVAGSARVLDGKTGAVLATSAYVGDYFMPIVRDVDDDDALDLTLYAGHAPAGTLRHALDAFLWRGTDADRPLTYGALTPCPQGAVLLGGSWSTPPQLFHIVTKGPAAGLTKKLLFAGGKAFPNLDDAKLAGAKRGQLGSPSVHENLGGDGVPIAVFGSTDGWLYGANACSGALAFAYHVGAPVGAVALGDADGDGLDEILASAADGYLYGFRQSDLPAVAVVRDTDPPSGITDADVDELRTVDTLHASWDPVEGAEGYEAAVVRSEANGGGVVSSGPWLQVGAATSFSASGLPLEDGHRYHVAVRAIAGSKRSPDRLSDGVRVVLDTTRGAGGGGAGGSGGAGGAEGAVDENSELDWLFGRGCSCELGARGGRDAEALLGLVIVGAALARRRGKRLQDRR